MIYNDELNTEITLYISSQEFSRLLDGEEFNWKIRADNKKEKVIIHLKLDKMGEYVND